MIEISKEIPKEEKVYITLEEILDSETIYDLYIESIDRYVKIKNATTRDRIDAETMALTHPGWSGMTPIDKELEVTKMLVLQIMQEPKITLEQYKNSKDDIMQVLISAVANEYNIKLSKLTEQAGANLKRFLEELLGDDLPSFMSFLSSKDSTSRQPVESGPV